MCYRKFTEEELSRNFLKCSMITLYDYPVVMIIFNIVNGTMFSRWNTHLDLLYQKPMRQQHHGKNLFEGLIPSGSRDKKRPAFKPTFEREWNSILYDMEEIFAELLFKEFVEAIISFIF